MAAVFVDQLEEWAVRARAAAGSADPWLGLCDYVRAVCSLQGENRGLADLLVGDVGSDDRIGRLRRSVWRSTLRVMRRAQRAGDLRVDAEPRDLRMMFAANAGVIAHSGDRARSQSTRFAELALAGLRPAATQCRCGPEPRR